MNDVRVIIPHAGQGTHSFVFAVEVDDTSLQLDDGLVDLLCERFRAEAQRVIAYHRNGQELELFLQSCRFSLEDLRAHDRRAAVSAARNELMWRLRQAGWTFERIGEMLHRHHSTVMHGCREFESDRAVAEMREQLAVAS